MAIFNAIEYTSEDGLRLYARDYPADQQAPVVLCLHGLTRNSADFEPLCDHLSPRYRLIVPDQRGRGLSQWDPHPQNYLPQQYNRDMLALLAALDIDRVHIIGTSMGGIMGILLGAAHPTLVASLVLNDIGPGINPDGVKLIAQMVSNPPCYSNWQVAADKIRSFNGALFPDFTAEDWLNFARRTCRQTERGVEPDYDPALGVPFAAGGDAVAPDLWPAFRQLDAIPLLVIRGAMSNILDASTCDEMAVIHPTLQRVELSNRGHAPILDEPPALAAIQALLLSAEKCNTTPG